MQHYFLGIGATQSFDGQGAIDFIKSIMKQHDIKKITAIASLKKSVIPAFFADIEKAFDSSLHLFSADELEKQTSRLKNPSQHVFNAVGCHGVCEAAALAVAGDLGELVVEKTSFLKMTIAISKATRI